jgi:hypothetical protein
MALACVLVVLCAVVVTLVDRLLAGEDAELTF